MFDHMFTLSPLHPNHLFFHELQHNTIRFIYKISKIFLLIVYTLDAFEALSTSAGFTVDSRTLL